MSSEYQPEPQAEPKPGQMVTIYKRWLQRVMFP